MTGWLKWLVLTPVLGLLTACAGFSVHYDYDRGASFAAYRSFDWAPADPKGKAQAPANTIMDRRVRRLLEQELGTKGLRLDPGGNPDLRIACYPVYRDRLVHTTTTFGPAWGWGYGWGPRPWGYGPVVGYRETQTYREGSIVVEMVDSRSNQLVWQGAADGALTGLQDPRDAEEQVALAVHKLLEKFPPAPNPQ